MLESVHIEGNDPRWNMPYTPAIKVHGGAMVFVSRVTAAPVYHSHPHDPAEFEEIPDDPALQTAMTVENRVMAEHLGDHRATSTTVEVVRLATDPRLDPALQ